MVLFKIRPAASGSGFRVLLKNVQGIIQRMVLYSGYYSKYNLQRLVQDSGYYSKYDLQRLVHYSGYYSKYDLQRLIHDSAYYLKISGVLFSVLFIIHDIIQNTTCSVWFRIQRIVKKYPGYYSAPASLFRVLLKIRPAVSGLGFSVL